VRAGVLAHSPIASTHARGKRSRAPVERFDIGDGDGDEDVEPRRRRRRINAVAAPLADDADASPVTKKARRVDGTVEARHLAAAEYRVAKATGRATVALAAEIGTKYKVGSGRTVRRLASAQRTAASLARKPGSGAPSSVLTEQFGVIIQKILLEKNGVWTMTRLTKAYNEVAKKEGVPTASRSTVGRWLKKHTKRRKRLTKPYLTDENKKARVDFAKNLLKNWSATFNRKGHIRVFVDETQVYAWSPNRYQYVPHALRGLFNENPLRLKSKTQIPKLMFMAGFAQPNPEETSSLASLPSFRSWSTRRPRGRASTSPRVIGKASR
jgi:transposase